MSVDNRITLNDCSAVFTGGDDTGSVTITVGSVYEGADALSVQFTNSDERTTTINIGGTRDLSDSTCWLLVKDNLIQTQALGGAKYVLLDGTNEIGYEVGGNDNSGLSLPTFFNSYRLDVSNSAAFTAHAFAGSEGALNKAAITGVGFGTNHLAKAVGSIDNCNVDRLSFIVNGSPALTVNGGTVGTPETPADVVADDITNGWGVIANPQGKQFNLFCSTEFGDNGTADSYFDIIDSQVTLNGIGVGAGNFDMSVIANTTGINSFKIDNSVIVNIGAVANWDWSDANSDIFDISNAQFVDGGNFLFPTSGGSKSIANSSWVGCGNTTISTLSPTACNWISSGQVNVTSTGSISDGAVKTSTATAAILTDDLTLIDNIDGESTGSQHHVELNSVGGGSMSWNCTTTGFDAGVTGSPVTPTSTGNEDLYVNVRAGTIDINVATGATVPSIRSAGATVNVVAGLVVLTINSNIGSEVRIKQGSFTLQHIQNIVSGSTTYTYTYIAGTKITITAGGAGLVRETREITLSNTDASITFNLIPNPSYI